MSFAGESKELRSLFTRLSDIQQQKQFHVFIIYHCLLNAFKDCSDTRDAFLSFFAVEIGHIIPTHRCSPFVTVQQHAEYLLDTQSLS